MKCYADSLLADTWQGIGLTLALSKVDTDDDYRQPAHLVRKNRVEHP